MDIKLTFQRTWLARTNQFGQFYYRLFGPTTVHLEHEVCLLVSTACLTTASLFSLYRSSFGLPGDFAYLFFTNVWLSRHFFHRLICTTDVGTSLSPWTQNLRWMWIIITSGGQYFDVPSSIFSSASYQPILDEYTAPAPTPTGRSRSGKDSRDVSGNIPMTLSPMGLHHLWIFQKTIIPLFAATWSCGKIMKLKLSPRSRGIDLDEDWVMMPPPTPTSRRNKQPNKHSFNSGSDHAKNKAEKNSFAAHYSKCKKSLNRKLDMWWQVVPPIQMLVLIISTCGIVWFFQKYNEATSSYSRPLRVSPSYFFDPHVQISASNDNGWQSQQDSALNSEFMTRKFEAVQGAKAMAAAWSKKFVYSYFGMVSMIASWGTIGCIIFYGRILPPLPDLIGGSGNVGKGSYKFSKPRNSKKAWSERFRSIVNENKFHLHFKVVLLRVFEYLVLCAILPTSEYTCKATGHCDVETMIFESGHPTLSGMRGRSMFNNLIYDRFQGGMIMFTVLLSTSLILISQIVILDKSYLALKSYTSLNPESTAVRKSGSGKRNSITEFSADFGKSQCQKHGIPAKISNFVGTAEKTAYNLFLNELGALSTSPLLSMASNIHVMYTLFVITMWIYHVTTGRFWYTFFFIYISLFSSAVEIGFLEKSALTNIANEIAASCTN